MDSDGSENLFEKNNDRGECKGKRKLSLIDTVANVEGVEITFTVNNMRDQLEALVSECFSHEWSSIGNHLVGWFLCTKLDKLLKQKKKKKPQKIYIHMRRGDCIHFVGIFIIDEPHLFCWNISIIITMVILVDEEYEKGHCYMNFFSSSSKPRILWSLCSDNFLWNAPAGAFSWGRRE